MIIGREVVAPQSYKGIIEFIVRDRSGRELRRYTVPNIVKIFAKEMLSHRLPHARIWDPNAGTGSGAWVASDVDPAGEFAAKYILFGASFDAAGTPLDTNDPRFYTIDPVTNKPVPIRLGVGAAYDGGLINAIPLADPSRPLKKVESISFESSYQPSSVPLLQPEVRAMNNVVLLETVLRLDEYNGFGVAGSSGSAGSSPGSDYFTITEVALAGGIEIDFLPKCEVKPEELFLQGVGGTLAGASIQATATGTDTVTLASPTDTAVIKEGDQIKIEKAGGSAGEGSEGDLGQVSPYYLVIAKQPSGSDMQLDRVPVNSSNIPITGTIGVFRTTLRLFSHRILPVPVRKSSTEEITVRWRVFFS
jgi:hypothetical protein